MYKLLYLNHLSYMPLIYAECIHVYSYHTIIILYTLDIRGYKQNDNAHVTTVTMVKLRSYFHSPTTPHTSPLRASDGVSFVSPPKKYYHDISRAHCMVDTRNDYSMIVSRANLAFASLVSIDIYLVTKVNHMLHANAIPTQKINAGSYDYLPRVRMRGNVRTM